MFQVWSDKQTHPGRKRSNNEDYVTSWEPKDEVDLIKSGRLYIVADGVGGASKGEKASKFAAEKVLFEYYRMPESPPEERLRRLIRQAGNDIHAFAEDSSTFMRMATTMVAAVVIGDRLTLAHVGDSRAYLIRNGEVTQLTKDHSWVAEMVRDGVMTEEEARKSKRKNRITRSLGGETDVRVDINQYQLQIGDKVLLCSDGFSQYATPNQIARLVAEGGPDEITQRLIKYANKNGGSDNISVIMLEIYPETFEIPTISRRRELEAPNPLEEMATTPGFEDDSRIPWKLVLRNPWFYLGGVGVLLLVILVSLLIGITDDEPSFKSFFDWTSKSTLTSIPPTSFIEQETLLSSGDISTATYMAEPTQTVMPTATFTPTPDLEANQNELITCQYTLTNDDYINWDDPELEKIDLVRFLNEKFQLEEIKEPSDLDEYNNNMEFGCADGENGDCAYDPNSNWTKARVGWVMNFPDIKPEVCNEVGGKPILIPDES